MKTEEDMMTELLQLKVRLWHLSPEPELVPLSGLQEAFTSPPTDCVQASRDGGGVRVNVRLEILTGIRTTAASSTINAPRKLRILLRKLRICLRVLFRVLCSPDHIIYEVKLM